MKTGRCFMMKIIAGIKEDYDEKIFCTFSTN